MGVSEVIWKKTANAEVTANNKPKNLVDNKKTHFFPTKEAPEKTSPNFS